jgi:hypothetical protein
MSKNPGNSINGQAMINNIPFVSTANAHEGHSANYAHQSTLPLLSLQDQQSRIPQVHAAATRTISVVCRLQNFEYFKLHSARQSMAKEDFNILYHLLINTNFL